MRAKKESISKVAATTTEMLSEQQTAVRLTVLHGKCTTAYCKKQEKLTAQQIL